MHRNVRIAALALAGLLFAGAAEATGLATCNSDAKSGWKTMDELRAQLTKQGWRVRRIKEDGGCYEVYAINAKGQRVESYFHPVTFQHVLTSTR